MAKQFQAAPELLAAVKADPTLQADIKADPVGGLEKLTAQPAFLTDPLIYRIVVSSLALTMFSAAGGAIYLGDKAPQSLVALGSTALGGLVGLLAPSPRQN
jgi:hypothetical protein